MYVSREGTTLITLHGGSNTTARDEAVDDLERTLDSLVKEGAIDDAEVIEAAVDEHPAAPFDPYTVAVCFRVGVDVDSDDADDASDRGAALIDQVLREGGVDDVSYTSPPTASA